MPAATSGTGPRQWTVREAEPHAAGVAAIRVPQEGLVDYLRVCAVLQEQLNAPSPAATASLALGERIARMV